MWKRTVVTGAVLTAFALGVILATLLPHHLRTHISFASSAPTAAQSPEGHKSFWTCGMHPQVIQDHPGNCPICHMRLTPLKVDDATASNAPEKEMSAGPRVTIDPTVVQNMGVRTAEVTRGPLDVTVRAVGVLKPPDTELHDVTLKVGGFIDKLNANTEGMHVQPGEVLFDLYSPELQVAEQELITAQRSLKSMDASAGEPVRREAEGLVDSARRKLLLWDVAPQDVEAIAKSDQPPRTVPFRSPAAGAIVEKAVVQGSAVQAGMKLMRIEGHERLWLDAEVYEEHIATVALGQTVEATVAGVPGRTFTGKVTFIYPHVDHMTRTETVRTTLDNPAMMLKPGMYATVRIVARPVADVVLAPRESVIDTGTRQIAFVAESDGHYDPRRVKVGLVGDDDRVQILEGLNVGERVVTSGQFLMDVESRTTEAIQKLRRGTTATTMPSMPEMKPIIAAAGGKELVVANCSMKKADWLQAGEELANPYFGTSMSTCGEVKRKLPPPDAASPLAPVASAYLVVQRELNADKLDAEAIGKLKSAADRLPGERFPELKGATEKLASATDLNAARAAFQGESAAVIAALEQTIR